MFLLTASSLFTFQTSRRNPSLSSVASATSSLPTVSPFPKKSFGLPGSPLRGFRLAWLSLFFEATAWLLYHAVFHLSSTFLNFFQKVFCAFLFFRLSWATCLVYHLFLPLSTLFFAKNRTKPSSFSAWFFDSILVFHNSSTKKELRTPSTPF